MNLVIKKICNSTLTYSGILLKLFIVTISIIVRKPGMQVRIGLFDCPITGVHFVIGHCSINDFAVRLRKNGMSNEPIRFKEIIKYINFVNPHITNV